MSDAYRFFICPLFVLLIVSMVSGASAAGPRVALVIGNGAYQNAPALANPANDAREMAKMLRRVGFEVMEGVDLGRAAMEDLIARFGEAARGAEVTVAFYAGHGVQVDGINYLLPVDARLEQDADLRRQILADWLVEDAGRAKRLALVILDACRNNPMTGVLRATERSLEVGQGLAQIQIQPPNTLIAYATAAGATTEDGAGVNSPFTTALLEHLPTEGLEIGLALRKVRDTVIARTGGRQQPFTYGSLGGEEIYFVPPVNEAAPAGTSSTIPSRQRENVEIALWRSIEGSQDPADFETYLRQFPSGVFARLARNRLFKLQAAASSPSPTPTEPATGADECGGMLEKAQLGERLSDEERARLRSNCR